MYNPTTRAWTGVTVIGEVNPLTAHLMNVLWMLGTFTFATVIGIITEDVTQTIMVRCCPHRAPLACLRSWLQESQPCASDLRYITIELSMLLVATLPSADSSSHSPVASA